MSKASGGGINSRVNVTAPVRYGSRVAQKVRPEGASQIGNKQVLTNSAAGKLIAGTAKQGPLGNELALNVGGGGVGKGRTVHPCGTQGRHGGGEG